MSVEKLAWRRWTGTRGKGHQETCLQLLDAWFQMCVILFCLKAICLWNKLHQVIVLLSAHDKL